MYGRRAERQVATMRVWCRLYTTRNIVNYAWCVRGWGHTLHVQVGHMGNISGTSREFERKETQNV